MATPPPSAPYGFVKIVAILVIHRTSAQNQKNQTTLNLDIHTERVRLVYLKSKNVSSAKIYKKYEYKWRRKRVRLLRVQVQKERIRGCKRQRPILKKHIANAENQKEIDRIKFFERGR